MNPAYFFSFSNDGYITHGNSTFLEHIGFSEKEVKTKKLEDLLTVGSKIFFQTHFYPLIKIQKKADEIYLSFLTKDKQTIPVLLNVILCEFDDGGFEINCGGIQISRRNRFEKELLEDKKVAQKALQENPELIEIREKLLATQQQLDLQLKEASSKSIDQVELNKILAHDLQEPLRKIGVYSSRLLSYENSNLTPYDVTVLQKISGFSEKVRHLLDSLERFNSLENKKVKLKYVLLPNLFQSLKSASEPDSNKVEMIFFDKTAKEKMTFNTDVKLMLNLFKELIKNALTFKSPEEELLTVKITADVISKNSFAQIKDRYLYKNYLRLIFESKGIENFNSKNAFELFKRHDSMIDELNISLPYCRRIVHLLHGEIRVSTNAQKLTTFSIILPFTD